MLVPDFSARPASAPNLTPDSPCVLGSATLGPLGENLPPSFYHTRHYGSQTAVKSPCICSFLRHILFSASVSRNPARVAGLL